MGRMGKATRAPHAAQCLHSSAMGFNPLHQQGHFMFNSLDTSLAQLHKALGSRLRTVKPGVMMHVCNLGPQKVEAGRLDV